MGGSELFKLLLGSTERDPVKTCAVYGSLLEEQIPNSGLPTQQQVADLLGGKCSLTDEGVEAILTLLERLSDKQ